MHVIVHAEMLRLSKEYKASIKLKWACINFLLCI